MDLELFQFYFDRRQGEDHDLGLHVERYPGNTFDDLLQVKHIYPGHLVAKQNARMVYLGLSSRCLLRGDIIESVNGKRDHDGMEQELRPGSEWIHMHVVREPEMPQNDSEAQRPTKAVKTKKAQKLTKAMKPMKAMKAMKVAASAAQKTSTKAVKTKKARM